MKNDAFSGFHPLVNLLFFVMALGSTMFVQQPVYLVISLLTGCGYLFYLRGKAGMLHQVGYLVPILVMMAVMNPLFNHEGITVLLYLPNDNPVTLEAMVFGLAAATMMGASIVWFNCCNEIFTSDKIIYLFGRVIPAMSLLISMALRFVPRFKNYLQNVLRVQKAMHAPENTRDRFQQALAAFSATVSWAMEQSIVSADSMKSRGYGIRGRTAFSIYLFEKRDGLAIAILTLLSLGAILPCATGYCPWRYYPSMLGVLWGPVQLLAYFCYGGMCLFPLIVDLMEDRKWNSFRSKI
jgi:energy-coupling factor transport system permease protein